MKIVKKLSIIILIILSFCLIFLLITRNIIPNNPKERNKITFKASTIDVQDSINAIIPYLNKMHVYNEDWVNCLISDSNELYLNFKNIGSIEKLLLPNNNELDFFTKSEKMRFLHLVLYLNDNYLFRCDFFKNTNKVKYIYRNFKDAGDYHSDLLRFITLDKPTQPFDNSRYQILDVKENLILFAYKDAEIQEGDKK